MKILKSAYFWWFVIGITLDIGLCPLAPAFGLAGWPKRLALAAPGAVAIAVAWSLLRQRELRRARAALREAPIGCPGEGSSGDRLSPRRKRELAGQTAKALDILAAYGRGKVGFGRRPLDHFRFYLLLGAEGAGKSSLLENSGARFTLKFPHADPADRVAGDPPLWWMTKRDIFLEPPQGFASAAGKDQYAHWLSLLAKAGKAHPLDGVILVLDLRSLLRPPENGAGGPAAQAAWAAGRLALAQSALRRELPVYLVFSHADALPGFAEFLSALDPAHRPEWLGATFSQPEGLGAAKPLFEREFLRLWEDLAGLAPAGLAIDAPARAARRALGFLNELGAALPPLSQAVERIFQPGMEAETPYFRGFFFTGALFSTGAVFSTGSGHAAARTGGASPMGSIAEGQATWGGQSLADMSMGECTRAPATPRPMPIEMAAGIFATVLKADGADAGLARLPVGRARRLSLRGSLVSALAFSAALAAAAYALHGFFAARRLGDEVTDTLRRAAAARWDDPARADRDGRALQALDRVRRALSAAPGLGIPPGYSPRGDALALVRGLEALELGKMVARYDYHELEEGLRLAAAPEAAGATGGLYRDLRLYLVLAGEGPAHKDGVDPRELVPALASLWTGTLQGKYGSRLPEGAAVEVEGYAGFYAQGLLDGSIPPAGAEDRGLVEDCRQALRGSPSAQGRYDRILAGLGPLGEIGLADLGLDRETPLSSPLGVRACYTKANYAEVALKALERGADLNFHSDWVLGSGGGGALPAGLRDRRELAGALAAKYREEYQKEWWAFLRGLCVRLPDDLPGAAAKLQAYATPAWGLPALLAKVGQETDLPPAPDPLKTAQGLLDKAKPASLGILPALATRDTGADPLQAGFAYVRGLAKPEAVGPDLQPYLADLSALSAALAELSQRAERERGALDFLQGFFQENRDNALYRAWLDADRLTAAAPPQTREWLPKLVEEPLRQAALLLMDDGAKALEAEYRDSVLAPFDRLLRGHYPIAPEARQDAYVEDLRAFLNPQGGILPAFVRDRLAAFGRFRNGAFIPAGGHDLAFDFRPEALRDLARGMELSARLFQPRSAEFRPFPLQLTLTGGDNIARAFFRLGDERVAVEGKGSRARDFRWPPADAADLAKGAEVGVELAGGSAQSRAERGPWALFRLLDGKLAPPGGGFVTGYTFCAGGKFDVRVKLEGHSPENPDPFVAADFFRLDCAPSLLAPPSRREPVLARASPGETSR